ncbi:uncharacterized protein LOC106471168 [Limulus polyphemus]|uniref:Uncharacterized protein LOC106471168 n=1 Tax=Limulus polyphemus TaxID=6850 RepID=A0ABM1BRF3_LIMPO|nr:uncharacterized protein LOC106471168 [Limulus polyphemus]
MNFTQATGSSSSSCSSNSVAPEIPVVKQPPTHLIRIEIENEESHNKNTSLPESSCSNQVETKASVSRTSDIESPQGRLYRPMKRNNKSADEEAGAPKRSKEDVPFSRSIHRSRKKVNLDLLTNKELGLRILIEKFPQRDIMELQDTLVSCEWNVKKAVCELTGEKYVPTEEVEMTHYKITEEEDKYKSLEKELTNQTELKCQAYSTKQLQGVTPSDQNFCSDGYDKKESKWLTKIHLTSSTKSYGKNSPKSLRGRCVQNPLKDFLSALKAQASSATEDLTTVNKIDEPQASSTATKLTTFKQDTSKNPSTSVKLTSTNNIAHPFSKVSTESLNESKTSQAHVTLDGTAADNIVLPVTSDKEGNALNVFNDVNSTDIHQISRSLDLLENTNLHDHLPKSLPEDGRRLSMTSVQDGSYANCHIATSDRRKVSKTSKKKKRTNIEMLSDDEDDDYKNEDVYNSEASDYCEDDDESLTPSRANVLNFFQTATVEEILTVPGCSKKKVDSILACRPFTGWDDLVSKSSNSLILMKYEFHYF